MNSWSYDYEFEKKRESDPGIENSEFLKGQPLTTMERKWARLTFRGMKRAHPEQTYLLVMLEMLTKAIKYKIEFGSE